MSTIYIICTYVHTHSSGSTYEKKHDDGTVETRVAYEVSIASMDIAEKEENNENQNQEETV